MYIVIEGILLPLCVTCEKNLCITHCCLTLHIIVALSQFCISPFVKVCLHWWWHHLVTSGPSYKTGLWIVFVKVPIKAFQCMV